MRVDDVVEYTAVCRCAGRQVPDSEQAKRLESSFRVVDEAAEPARGNRPRRASQPDLSEARVTPEVRERTVAAAPVASSLASRSPGLDSAPAHDAALPPRRQLPERESRVPRTERPTPAPRVPSGAVFGTPKPTLSELASTIRLERSQEVLSTLSKHGINTLEDIRTAGGIRKPESLGVDPDHPAVMALQAHANLSVLSPDLQVNAKLIDKGFTNIASVAGMPSELFVETMRDDVGEQKALQLSYQSKKQKAILDNIMIDRRTNAANGRISFDTEGEEEAPPPET
jgi:hypothetical protein